MQPRGDAWLGSLWHEVEANADRWDPVVGLSGKDAANITVKLIGRPQIINLKLQIKREIGQRCGARSALPLGSDQFNLQEDFRHQIEFQMCLSNQADGENLS